MSDFSVPSWSKYVIGKYFEEDLTRLIQTKLDTFSLKLVHVLISIRGRSTPVSTENRSDFSWKKNFILNLANIPSEWLKNPGKVTLGSWNQKNFTVVHPPDLSRSLRPRRSLTKSVSIYPRSAHEYSPLALYGERVQAFAVTISGIVWVDKRCLWLFNVFLEYHRPITTNACPPKPSQRSLHPTLEPILPGVSLVLRTNPLPLWLELVEKIKDTFIRSSLALLRSTQSDMFLRKEYLRNKLKNKVNSISYLAGTVFRSL